MPSLPPKRPAGTGFTKPISKGPVGGGFTKAIGPKSPPIIATSKPQPVPAHEAVKRTGGNIGNIPNIGTIKTVPSTVPASKTAVGAKPADKRGLQVKVPISRPPAKTATLAHGAPKAPPVPSVTPAGRTPTLFDKIRDRLHREGVVSMTRQSKNWLREKVSSLGLIDRAKLIESGRTTSNRPMIGNMYFFFYDAKTKDKLPYWDRFPLVFPIHFYDDGFLGINLHYLDRVNRLRLFDKLQQFATDRRYDARTKLILSWELLSNAAKFPEVGPCVKRYLASFVRSRFLKIEPAEMEIATMLPVESFQKATAGRVWRDSSRRFGR